MAERYNRDDVAPGVYVEGGNYYYDGQVIPTASIGNKDLVGKKIAEINEAKNRKQTQTTGWELASKKAALADEFQANLPKYTGLLQDQSRKTIQRTLAENINNLKQRSSSAGFLGGSGTQKQQAEALAGAQTETMAKDSDIKDVLSQQAQQLKNESLATNMAMQGSANQATIDALRQNILDSARQTELWKALGQATGTGIGAYYGAKGNQSGS